MTQSYKNKSGRPTKTTQLQNQRTIREYYELGVSAAVTASRTGRNIKTVYRYYEEFSEQILESESGDEYLEEITRPTVIVKESQSSTSSPSCRKS